MYNVSILALSTLVLLATAGRCGAADAGPGVLRRIGGHQADVRGVAFSPDGRRVATASSDGTVGIWDSVGGVRIASLTGHGGRVLSIAWSPDGQMIASSGDDRTLRLWGLPGPSAARIGGKDRSTTAIALSPDGTWLATSSADGALSLWRVETHNEAIRIDGRIGPAAGGAVSPAASLAFSPDGRRLAEGGADGSVRIRDVSSATAPVPAPSPKEATAQILAEDAPWRYFKGTSEPPREWASPGFDDSAWPTSQAGFGFSSNHEELATVRTRLDDMVGHYVSLFIRARFRIDDPARIEKLTLRVLVDDGFVAYLNGKEADRNNARGSPPAFNAIAQSSAEPHLVEVDLLPHASVGENVLAIQGHNSSPTSSDFVLTPGVSAVLKPSGQAAPAAPKLDLSTIPAGSGAAGALAWSADGKAVAAGHADGTIRVWKVEPTASDGTRPGPAPERQLSQDGPVRGIVFLDAGLIAAAGGPAGVCLWNLAQGRVVGQIQPPREILAISASPDRSRLLTGAGDGTVTVWDARELKESRSFRGHQGPVGAVAFGPDPKIVASGGADGTLRAWKVDSGEEIRRFQHSGALSSVAVGREERYYSLAPSGEFLEWRASSSEARHILKGHGGMVHCVVFSPDSGTIATAGADGTVRLWSVVDAREIRSLTAHEPYAYAAAFSPDGASLATGGFEGTVKVWNARTGELVKALDGKGGAVFCVSFSADGRFLYSAGSDCAVRRWRVLDGADAGVLAGHDGWICAVEPLPAQGRLASLDAGGGLAVWDVDGVCPLVKKKIPSIVYDMAVSPDGQMLAVASFTGEILLITVE